MTAVLPDPDVLRDGVAVADGSVTPATSALRVRAAGRTRQYDGPRARLGRLAFERVGAAWSVVDDGVQGGVHLRGCRVGRVAVVPGHPVTLRIGAPDGPEVVLDLLRPPEPEPKPAAEPTPAAPRDTAEPAADPRRCLSAAGLTVRTDAGRVLLDDVSLTLRPGTLTALIGPSGAGKSTLLRVLTGQLRPDGGTARWRGADLHGDYDDLRAQIGLVPQEEIQHPQLAVRASLDFAARLRLPGDTTRRQRDDRIDQVIEQVGLERQQHQRIGSQLSGGQRKRVSIAAELLTAPPLLFLDEPTSGLDPGMDRAVMQQLADLAAEDRIVVVATHSVLGIEACDNVVVMARGGRVVHVGPPDGLLEHFGVADHPALFDLLGSAPASRLGRHREPALRRTGRPARAAVRRRTPPSFGQQLGTLVRRDLAVLLADRLHLAMLLLMPLALAGLSRLVQGSAGLSLRATRIPGVGVDGTELTQRLTLLLIAASLMGVAMTVRELVGERAIHRREYAVGLSPGAYLTSKVVVFGTACFLQGVLVTRLALLGLPAQDHDGGVHGLGWWEIAVPIGLLAAVMAVAGLCVSAVVRSVEQTAPALVAVVMSQVVLASALVHLAGRPVLEQLSWLAPSRWAYAAMASSTHLDRSLREGTAPDPLWIHGTEQWNLAVGVLLGFGALLTLVTLRLLRRG